MKYITQFEETVRQWRHDAFDAGQKVWFAGMGAAGMVGHTTSTVFNTLVEEGKRVQGTEGDRLGEVLSRTKTNVKNVVDETVDRVQQNVLQVTKVALDRLGLPSRTEIAELSSRLEALTAKVENLARKGGGHARV